MNTRDENQVRDEFLKAPTGRLISKHALPAIASMLFMALYQIVDGVLVGRRLGADALASVNILYPIIALLSGLAVMIGVGGNTRIAVLMGAGKQRQANRILGLITSMGIGLGVFLSLASYVLMPLIMSFLGTSGQMGAYASVYLMQLLPFFTFMILMFILSQAVRNDGQPGLSSAVMAGSALLNVALDYLFLFVLDLGIAGAALATGLAQTAGALVFLSYFIHKSCRNRTGLFLSRPTFRLQVLKAVIINGSSELFNSLAAGLTTFLFNRAILAHVGPLGIAAFTLVQYLLMLGMALIIGVGNGVQPIISYNYGAGLYSRVQRVVKLVSAIATLAGIALFFLISWQITPAIQMFLPDQPDALVLTLEVASLVRWSLIFMPLAMLGSIFLTALEKAGQSLLLAMFRGLILPAAGLFILPAWLGAAGIWITPLIAESLTVLLTLISLAHLYRKSLVLQTPQPLPVGS